MSRRTIGAVLAVVGALLLADAALTLLWREPVSWALHRGDQAQLRERLAQAQRDGALAPGATDAQGPAAAMAHAARRLGRSAQPGDPLGSISIPRIGARFVVVEGTGRDELREGPGHYVHTALPGESGTVGLAGHRTTYQQPFRSIDALAPGDRIVVRMPYGRFTYRVTGTRIVAPSQVSVLARASSGDQLVLTACHPLFSARQRIVVTARLTAAEPRMRS
ncbi:unannotated protein [freshwater metagenome]|uniref:Unannotated protein n=1 Tax=freshwater metagenome TaxID=449393 RepID=A0A6J7HFJ1_9ZZZZ|nr:sortase [Actinomycetota bacterium]